MKNPRTRPVVPSPKRTDFVSRQLPVTPIYPENVPRKTKPLYAWAVISSCLRTALLGAGSSAVAAGTYDTAAAITLAILSATALLSSCTVVVIQSWNRDATVIDARARSKILRIWARRASTLAEMERVFIYVPFPSSQTLSEPEDCSASCGDRHFRS